MRYEQKFVFSNDEYNNIISRMMLSGAMFSEIYKSRQINNIYLDTVNYNDYFSNINGCSSRIKHRIRWYGDTKSPSEAILEYKIKEGALGYKQFYKIPGFSLDNDFRYTEYIQRVQEITKTKNTKKYYQMYSDISSLLPTLYNTYKRSYFASCDNKYRVTIDTDMTFYKMGEVYYGMQGYEISDIVVELKFDKADIADATKIVKELGFRVTKNSKYINGVENFI